MSGENHSEKLHRNDRDQEFRPGLVSDEFEQQKRVDNESEVDEQEAQQQDDHASQRMGRLALNGVGKPPGKDKQLAATDEVKALDGIGKAPSKEHQEEALADFRAVNEEQEQGEEQGEEKSAQHGHISARSAEDGENEQEHEEGDGKQKPKKPSKNGAKLAMDLFRAVNGGPSLDGAKVAMDLFREVNGESEESEEEKQETKVQRTEVHGSAQIKGPLQTKDDNLLAPNGASNENKTVAPKQITQPNNAALGVTGEVAGQEHEGEEKATDHKEPVFLNPFMLALSSPDDAFEKEADRVADQVMAGEHASVNQELGSGEQHEQELDQLAADAQQDPQGAQQTKKLVTQKAAVQQQAVQQQINADVAKVTTGGQQHAARRGSSGNKRLAAARQRGQDQQTQQRQAVQAKKVKKAKSIAELKTRLADSFKAKSDALKADIEAQRTELKTKLAAEKQKLADSIKAEETKLATEIAKRNSDLEKKIADKKTAVEAQNAAELAKAEQTSAAEQQKITTAGNAEAARIEAQGTTEAANAKRGGSAEASKIRARARQQAEAARKKEGGESEAQQIIAKGNADAKAAEARAAREGESRVANAHKMAEQAKVKAAGQVTDLKAKLDATRETLRKNLADATAAADAERQTMMKEVQAFIDSSKKEMALKTDESNVRINQLEKDSTAKIDAVETQTKKKIQQQHDDLLIKLEGPNAAKELAKLDEETNKVCEEIDKAVSQAQTSVRQEVQDAQAAAARQTQERILAVQAEGKKALDRITAKAAETERKIDEAAAQLDLKNKAAIEAQDRETKEKSGTAVAELKAYGDKSVGDLKKSTEVYEKERAAEEAAAAAKKAAEEKQKADAEKARLAEEKRKQDEAAAAEKAKKAEFERKTKGAANDLFAAMEGWGTDETKVFAALRGKSPEEMVEIKKLYLARTGRALDADLTAEMSGTELKEAKALLSQDPVQSRVAALQNAMDGWGTDEKKVKETLASITDPELKAKVVAEFEKTTGQKLNKALAAEGMESEGVKPDEFKAAPSGAKLDEAEVKKLSETKDVKAAASAILAATDRWGTDERAISEALKGKTPEQIAAIKAAFKQHSGGKDLDEVLEEELSGTELTEAKALMSADPVQAAVAQLHNASSGFGTDTAKIHETLKGITDPELRKQVTAEYEKQTGDKLDDMLEDELSGFDKDKARAYAEGNKAKISAVEADAAMHGGFLTNMADGVADTFGIDRQMTRNAVGGTLVAVIAPFGGPTVAAALNPGTDFGTDNKALFTALESCKDQKERDELIAAYKERTNGRDLMADVMADLEGKEKDVAKYIMAGDKASAEAAKMAVGASGIGTDRAAIFEALEKAESKAERDAIIAKYNELYGKDGETFEKMLDSELDDLDKAKAEQLAKQGRMDDGFALYYAMNEGFLGIGTDDDLLKQKLAGKSKEEIEKLKAEYAAAAKQYGNVEGADLIADVQGETSGRAGHELRQAMKGNPTTLEEMRQRLAEDYAFERTESGWVGDAAMFIMNPLGYQAAKAAGVDSTDIANGLTDMWSGSGKRLDQTHSEIEAKYLQIKADPRFADYDKFPPGSPERAAMDRAMMAELQGTADWQEGDLKAFQEAKDATADVASTAVTIAVGAVITIASGGTAAPAVVALISGLAGVSTKMLIKGGSMSNEEIVQETASVIAEAAAAGIVKIEKINTFIEHVSTLTGGNNKLLAKIVSETLEEAIESGSEELINAMLDPELYKGDLADWAKGVSQRTGKAMVTGGFAGGVAGGVGDFIPEGKTWVGRAGAGALSQSIGSVATAAIDPGSYEGSQEEKLVRFGRSVGEAALRGARDSLGGGGSDPSVEVKTDGKSTHTNVDTNVDTNNSTSTPPAVTNTSIDTGPETNVSTAVDSKVEIQSSQQITPAITVDNDSDITADLELADALVRTNTAESEQSQQLAIAEEASELEQAASNLEDEAQRRKAEDDARERAWQEHEAVRARLEAEQKAKKAADEKAAWELRAKQLAEQKASEEQIAWAQKQAQDAKSETASETSTTSTVTTVATTTPTSLVGDTTFKTDKNNDGVQDAARVGVEGTSIPGEIPRLPGLDPKQQAAETRFAEAYERDPQALAREYLELVMSGQTDKESKNFATDDAKLLSPDYNPADAGPTVEGQVDPKIAARGYMNIAVHQTANAVAKLAFTMRLDQIAGDSGLAKKILVTAGGVGAGKSYAIDNNPQALALKQQSSAVWDSAGEQNSTELPWVIAEAQKRGIEVAIVYVHRRPEQSWENMKFGVIPRAAKTGRMVDARLHADSYAEGARNFDAVQQQMGNIPGVQFVVIDATGDAPVQIDQLPQSALELDADTVHARNVEFLESKKNELPEHVVQGGNAIGEKIWGKAQKPPGLAGATETVVETKTETKPATENESTETSSETVAEVAAVAETLAPSTEPAVTPTEVISVEDLAQIESRTVTKGSQMMKTHVAVGIRTTDKGLVESVLGRVVAGDKKALADLGVTGKVEQSLVADRVEWAVGKIQTAAGTEYMLIKGSSLQVDISQLPGVELVAHNHPRASDTKLGPEDGSLVIGDLVKTDSGFLKLFPSAPDLAYSAEYGQESHTIFLPYRDMGDGLLANSDDEGAAAGQPVSVTFKNAKAVPGTDPQQWAALVEWHAGGKLLHSENVVAAINSDGVSSSRITGSAPSMEQKSESPAAELENLESPKNELENLELKSSEVNTTNESTESESTETEGKKDDGLETKKGNGPNNNPPNNNPPNDPPNKKTRTEDGLQTEKPDAETFAEAHKRRSKELQAKRSDGSAWATTTDRKGVPEVVPLTRQELRNVIVAKYGATLKPFLDNQIRTKSPELKALLAKIAAEEPGFAQTPEGSLRMKEYWAEYKKITKATANRSMEEVGIDETPLRTMYNIVEKMDMKDWMPSIEHLPLEQQAKLAHMWREEWKQMVRDMMVNGDEVEFLHLRDRGLYGDRRGRRFEEYVRLNKLETGGDEDEAMRMIIESSRRSNKEVNKDKAKTEDGLDPELVAPILAAAKNPAEELPKVLAENEKKIKASEEAASTRNREVHLGDDTPYEAPTSEEAGLRGDLDRLWKLRQDRDKNKSKLSEAELAALVAEIESLQRELDRKLADPELKDQFLDPHVAFALAREATSSERSQALHDFIRGNIEAFRKAQDQARQGVDPELRAKREVFERALAKAVLSGPLKEAVDSNLLGMCKKALDYINKLPASRRDQALASLGVQASGGYAGAVLTGDDVFENARTMEKVLLEGNVRERMIALGKFAELVASDLHRDDGSAFESVASQSTGAEGEFSAEDAQAYRERMAKYREQIQKSKPGLLSPDKEKDFLGGFLKPLAIDTGEGQSQHDYSKAKGQDMDTKLPSVSTTLETTSESEFPSEQDTLPENKKTPGMTGMGESSTLARTTITIEEAQAMGYELSPREIKAAMKNGGVLPWVVGTIANVVDPKASFIQTGAQNSLPQKAGISGTTYRFMEAAMLLGGDAEMSRLAMLGALQVIDAHTVYEIASAANGFMDVKFDPKNPYLSLGLPRELLEELALGAGTSLAELNGETKKSEPPTSQ